MEYNIIFTVVAINLAYLSYTCLKNDWRGNIFRAGQLLLIFLISTIPYIRSIINGTGLTNPVSDGGAETALIVAFLIFVLLPPLLDISRMVLLRRDMVKVGLLLSYLNIALDWSALRRRAHKLYMVQAKVLGNQIEEAEIILKDLLGTTLSPEFRSSALQNLISVYASSQQWENAVEQYEYLCRIEGSFFHVATFVNVIRAYGELGHLEKAESLVNELKNHPLAARHGEDKAAEMILSALKGEVEKTREMIRRIGKSPALPAHAPEYWAGRALLHAGRGPEAVEHFEKALTLLEKKYERNREAINEYIERARENDGILVPKELPDAGQSSAESVPVPTGSLKDSAFQTSLFSPAPLVYIIILANLAVQFLVEISGDATNTYMLLEYGAASKYLINKGEWWRIITASFLHYGYVHLLFNMFMILVLGMYIHGLYGKKRFLITYAFSALMGGLFTYIFQKSFVISMGASTAVLGLFGVMFVFGLRNRPLIPARFKKMFGFFMLPWILVIIAIGVIFPGIDNAGHIGGFFGGILTGLFLQPVIILGKTEKDRSITVHAVYVCSILLLAAGLIFAARPVWTDESKVYSLHEDAPSGVTMKLPYLWKADKKHASLFYGPGVVFYYSISDIEKGKNLEYIRQVSRNIQIENIKGPVVSKHGYIYTTSGKCLFSEGKWFDACVVFYSIRKPSSDRTAVLTFIVNPDYTELAGFISEKIAGSLEFTD